MSDPVRRHSGVRLPLILLLTFLTLVAGVVVWLTVAGPVPDKTPSPPQPQATAGHGGDAEPPATDSHRAPPAAAAPEAHAPVSPPTGDDATMPHPPATDAPGASHADGGGDAAPATHDTAQTPAPHPPAQSTDQTSAEPPAASHDAPPGDAAIPPPPAPAEEQPAAPHADAGNDGHGSETAHAATPHGGAGEQPAEAAPPKAAEQHRPPAVAATPVPPPAPGTPGGPSDTISIAKLPPINTGPPLKPAPDPDLIQVTNVGPLPQRAEDGRAPWRVYARPFDRNDKRPRIALVITGLGMSQAATESAIQGLPGAVTLAFAPYAPNLDNWIKLARAAGHEVLMDVPMEPLDYPAYDPGPQTLLTSLNNRENLSRLMWVLSRGTGYVGVIDFMGSRFTATADKLEPVLDQLKKRGLLYLDSGSSARSVAAAVAGSVALPSATATLTLDERASRVEIDKMFAKLEETAKREKRAIGVGSPYPVTLERMATWTRQLVARGFALAPVSAMVGVTTRTGAKR